jgi:hypothetical protein
LRGSSIQPLFMASNIRLGDLLNALSESEKIDFQRFVASPYFHDTHAIEEVLTLLTYLLGQKNNSSLEDGFDKELAYHAIFPDKKFVEKKIEKLLSVLHQLLKRFIIMRQRADQEFDGTIAQLTFFRERNLHNRFDNLSTTLLQSLAQEKKASHKTLKNQFLLDYEICSYDLAYNAKKSHVKILETIESLEASFLFSKLELLNQCLMAQKKTFFEMPPEMKDIIDNTFFPEALLQRHPILMLSYRLFRLLEKDLPEVSDFDSLQRLFDENEDNIDEGYIQVLYTYLRSLCAMLVNNNQVTYLPILFKLHQKHYEKGYLTPNGLIYPFTLLSVSNTALLLGEIEWCDTFIEETAFKIMSENPDRDFYKICKANLLFFKKQFEEALAILPTTFNNFDFLLFARRLEIKCYYELKSDLLDYKVDAFKMYVSRASKAITEQVRERNANFINLLTQINNSRIDDAQRAKKLMARIESKQLITDREWLIEKVKMMG